MELNNSNSNSNNRAEQKILLIIKSNFISVKDTRTIYSASKTVENVMGSDTENTVVTRKISLTRFLIQF